MFHSAAEVLLPLHFLSATGHLVLVLLSALTMDGNIRAALPLRDFDDAIYYDYAMSMTIAVVFTIVCIVVEFGGFVFGLTTFNASLNCMHILCHFLAIALLSHFIVDAWHYSWFWYIFALFSAIPALFETTTIAKIVILRVNQY